MKTVMSSRVFKSHYYMRSLTIVQELLLISYHCHWKLNVQCLISTVYHPPSTINRLPSAFYHPPSTIHRLPSTFYHPPSTIHRLPSTVYHPPSTIHRLPSSVYNPQSTIFHLLSTNHKRKLAVSVFKPWHQHFNRIYEQFRNVMRHHYDSSRS